MKNPWDVLRAKELELARVEREVDALKIAAPLLQYDGADVKQAVADIAEATSKLAQQEDEDISFKKTWP